MSHFYSRVPEGFRGKLLGWRTVSVPTPTPRASLVARQNDGLLEPFPVWDDVRTFDGKPWRGIVDVVSGGFPCQDISCAGKGDGLDGERSGLWSEFARILGEVRPRFAFIENSPMLTLRGGVRVIADLAALGFSARWGVISAADAGAPHRRERIWIVADADRRGFQAARQEGNRDDADLRDGDECSGYIQTAEISSSGQDVADAADHRRKQCVSDREAAESIRGNAIEGSGQGVADADGGRLEIGLQSDGESKRFEQQASFGNHVNGCSAATGANRESTGRLAESWGQCRFWSLNRRGRVANGVAARVDRLRCLGNGQVPGVAALAWRVLGGGE